MGRGDDIEPSGQPGRAPSSPPDPVDEATGLAREAFAQLLDARLWARSDDRARTTLAAATHLKAMAEAFYLAAVRDLDGRSDAVAGARAGHTARTFLVHRLRVAPGQAGRDVAAAKALDPDTGTARELGRALACGHVSREHVDVAVRALRRIPAHLLTRVGPHGRTGAEVIDEIFTAQARAFAPDTTRSLARQLLQALAPDRADRFDPDAFTRRAFTCVTDSTGMLVGRLQLDPAAAAVVKAGLQAFGRPAPLAAAITPDGQQVLVGDDRTVGQRNADALVTAFRMALHGSDDDRAPGASTTPATQVTVIATPEQLVAAFRAQPEPGAGAGVARRTPTESARAADSPTAPPPRPTAGPPTAPRPAATSAQPPSRTRLEVGSAGMADCLQTGPLDPATFGRLTCDAVLRTVFTTPSGAPLDLGRSVRTVSTAQRRALLARDGGCVIPGCTAPVAACDAHHARWWRNGGGTDIANLALLCGHHHTGVHAGIWSLQIVDGMPWVIPPRWVDEVQRPVRNQIPDARQHVRRTGRQLRLWYDAPAQPDG